MLVCTDAGSLGSCVLGYARLGAWRLRRASVSAMDSLKDSLKSTNWRWIMAPLRTRPGAGAGKGTSNAVEMAELPELIWQLGVKF
jgi:hypothetical protein